MSPHANMGGAEEVSGTGTYARQAHRPRNNRRHRERQSSVAPHRQVNIPYAMRAPAGVNSPRARNTGKVRGGGGSAATLGGGVGTQDRSLLGANPGSDRGVSDESSDRGENHNGSHPSGSHG